MKEQATITIQRSRNWDVSFGFNISRYAYWSLTLNLFVWSLYIDFKKRNSKHTPFFEYENFETL